MKFDPIENSFEDDKYTLLEKGVYKFNIISATDTVSKNGNDMCVVEFNIDGTNKYIKDYFVNSVEFHKKKLSKLCKSIDLEDECIKGLDTEMLVGKSGECLLGVQEEQTDQNGNTYKAKNVITKYVNESDNEFSKKNIDELKKLIIDEKTPDFIDDDLPF